MVGAGRGGGAGVVGCRVVGWGGWIGIGVVGCRS